MRGALLVLALLVTQALGVKMAETCPIFYDVFFAVANGNELLLDLSLTKVNATEPERTAMKKIQDCYVENGLISRVLDGLVMPSTNIAWVKQFRTP
uniref:Isoform 3 of Major allergen I polypeptide chain 2 n=1 Tax=Felis catus TaxID=9685 RepID=P30440-3